MKNKILIFAVFLASLFSSPVFSQNNEEPEALGLPGDNLNLYAVLDVFQKSKTLEEFEKSINDNAQNINNLDLNNDRNIDYIKVLSYKEGNSSHSIVLQVAINSKENQDVAVIEVNTSSANKVRVQIIGDKDLYGKNYIVEPSNLDTVSGTPNPGYTGSGTVIVNNTTNNYSNNNGLYAANDWPVVVYLFSPVYVVYRSPWYWGYYPSYWHPWAPVYYHNYWGYHNHYYRNNYYRRTSRVLYSSNYSNYSNRRNSSALVRRNSREGNYRDTYNGRDYKRPTAPNTRPTTRPTNPTTRPGTGIERPTTRPTNPTTRPTTRPTDPSIRPGTGTDRPTTRPTNPTTRPTDPTTRPTNPTTRPTNPTTRPSVTTPSTRPTTPSVRSETRPSTPSARSSREATPSTRRN